MSEPVQEFQIETVKPGPVVVRQSDPFMQLVQMAVEKGDLNIIEKMMDLKDRNDAKLAKQTYDAAMVAFKKEVPEILKNKHVRYVSESKGTVTEYDHASLDAVCDAVIPVLAKHGIIHDWKADQSQAPQIKVTCITSCAGHSEETHLTAGPDTSGGKNSIQGIASAVSYLQRYTLLMALGLAPKGPDNDGHGATASKMGGLDIALKAIADAPDTSALTTMFKASMTEAIKTCDGDAQRKLTEAKTKRWKELHKEEVA